MKITAKMVKELRQMTGAGMMNCKDALTEAEGNMELANDILRKKGLKIADKKAGRDANEGLIGIFADTNKAVVAEVNCETDFVTRTEGFQDFMTCVLTGGYSDTTEIIAKLGENIKVHQIVHFPTVDAVLATYVHGEVAPNMGKIGVAVTLRGESNDKLAVLGKQIAMHIAASKPKAVTVKELDSTFIENEKRLLTEQAIESGKPANIVEKMVAGRMQKILREVTLVDQPFVIDPDKTVGKVLEEAGAFVVSFVRLEIGG